MSSYAQGLAEPAHEVLVPVRLRTAQAVVEVRALEDVARLPCELPELVQQIY